MKCRWLPFLDTIEPCALRRNQSFGACLRKSDKCGSPPKCFGDRRSDVWRCTVLSGGQEIVEAAHVAAVVAS
jgi:hypothetical protein